MELCTGERRGLWNVPSIVPTVAKQHDSDKLSTFQRPECHLNDRTDNVDWLQSLRSSGGQEQSCFVSHNGVKCQHAALKSVWGGAERCTTPHNFRELSSCALECPKLGRTGGRDGLRKNCKYWSQARQ